MTTTSTYQGMNSEGKPSSRVLNPPGGASNNIFGFDNEPVQKTPIKNNPDNVNRGNNDIFHQGTHAAAAPPPKSRAPRSGDDSFHSLFGSDKPHSDINRSHPRNDMGIPKKGVENSKSSNDRASLHSATRGQRSHHDSFSSVFGDNGVSNNVGRRKMMRQIKDPNDDSFSRVFGHSDGLSSNGYIPSAACTHPDSSHPLGQVENTATKMPTTVLPSHSNLNSLSSSSVISSCRGSPREDDGSNSSFNRVFGQYMGDAKPSRVKRFTDRGGRTNSQV